MRPGRVIGALAALILSVPVQAHAQAHQDAFSAGPRVGYEFGLQALLAGGFVRLGIPGTSIELQSVADVSFARVTERQVTVDLLYRTSSGFYLGGGPVFWNSRFVSGGEVGARETRTGYSLIVTLGTGVESDRSVMSGIEMRWIFLNGYKPRTMVAQLGLPLIRF